MPSVNIFTKKHASYRMRLHSMQCLITAFQLGVGMKIRQLTSLLTRPKTLTNKQRCKMKKQDENQELITSSDAFINSLSHLLPLK